MNTLLVTPKPSFPNGNWRPSGERPRFCSLDRSHLLICDAKAQYCLAHCYPVRSSLSQHELEVEHEQTPFGALGAKDTNKR